jgi:D-amino-acid oxidase
MNVLIVGAGVIGLSTALEVRRRGHSVTVWAREIPPHTTSNVAAAIWYPYYAAPEEKVRRWAGRTLERFIALGGVAGSGVSLRTGTKLFHRKMGLPWWAKQTTSFRTLRPMEMLTGHVSGYRFEIPVIDMSVYLQKLVTELATVAIPLVVRDADLTEALTEFDAVILCCGLGARELVGDTRLFPIRGQLVHIPARASKEFLLESDDAAGMVYIVPRESECILGGVAEKGSERLEPDHATTRAIVARCAAFEPDILSAPIQRVSVGLRPGRDEIRLGRESVTGPSGTKILIHHYGHGGSGVTLSWGAAEAAADLLES